MIGVDLGTTAAVLRGGERTPLILDLIEGVFQRNGEVASSLQTLSGVSLSRSGPGTALTVAGAVATFATGTARITDRGLLLETAATNLMAQSQAIGTTPWIQSVTSITPNQTVAPDGTSTADLLTNGGTANTFYYVRVAPSLTQGVTYTVSVFAKAKSGSGWMWLLGETSGNAFAWFNVATGTTGTTSPGVVASIAPAANGFWRCTATFTKTSASGTEEVGFGLAGANGAASFAPSGVGTEEIHLWQADLVTGAVAGSPIVTTTGAQTRSADVATLTVPPEASTYQATYGAGNTVIGGSVTPGASFDLVTGRPWLGLGNELKRLVML